MHNIVSLRLARNAQTRGCTCELYGVFQDAVTQSPFAITTAGRSVRGSSANLGPLTSVAAPLTQMSDNPCEASKPQHHMLEQRVCSLMQPVYSGVYVSSEIPLFKGCSRHRTGQEHCHLRKCSTVGWAFLFFLLFTHVRVSVEGGPACLSLAHL